MKDYHINIFYSDEDQGYIADIPDLPHCSAFGETPEEALAEVLQAKSAWLETARAEGKKYPLPCSDRLYIKLDKHSITNQFRGRRKRRH